MGEQIITELAEFMHDESEYAAQKLGLKTQEECRLLFADLPEHSKKVMLYVARQVYYKYIKSTDESGEVF